MYVCMYVGNINKFKKNENKEHFQFFFIYIYILPKKVYILSYFLFPVS